MGAKVRADATTKALCIRKAKVEVRVVFAVPAHAELLPTVPAKQPTAEILRVFHLTAQGAGGLAAKARHIEPSAIARVQSGSYKAALAAEKAPRRFPVVIPVLNVRHSLHLPRCKWYRVGYDIHDGINPSRDAGEGVEYGAGQRVPSHS
jgi:hypothetical protein